MPSGKGWIQEPRRAIAALYAWHDRPGSADATRQAGYGDFVYLIGSKEAALLFRQKYTPVDAAIAGFIDRYDVEIQKEKQA